MTSYSVYNSPVGYLRIECRGEKVVGLHLVGGAPTDLGETTALSDRIYAQLLEYFGAERQTFDIEVDISHCTPFQQRVLRELQRIPYGECRSYKEIATALGNPKASRAVGMANNRNPIAIIIPCHRVIGAKGDLVGYASGLDNKRFLLDLERTR